MMSKTRFRCLGSTAIHLAYVAKGAMIGAVTAGAKLWDFAAGAILIERAGGIFTDINGNSPFPIDMDSYNGKKIPVIASSEKVFPEIQQLFGE